MMGRLRVIASELRLLNFRASDYPGGRGDTHIAGPYPGIGLKPRLGNTSR